jgi:hypothetical protein
MDYKSVIKREIEHTPENIVSDGKAVFGTFDGEFEKLDLLDIKNPTGRLPKCLKKFRLTLWESVEVNLADGILLAAPCNMGIFGTMLFLWYDKATKKITQWNEIIPAKNAQLSENLLNGSVSFAEGKTMSTKIVNNFQDDKASVEGKAKSKTGAEIEYKFELSRVSLPCVVSIPFGENRPLYSQKDLFRAEGFVKINGVEYKSDGDTTAIIDDHKGYYPYRAHYDWVTTMGKCDIDGSKKYFAINLTRNQSLDQDKYNENLIFLEGARSMLPPIKFQHSEDGKVWTVKDDYGMVDITFDIGDKYAMLVHAGVIDIRYFVTFGSIKGFVLDTDGKKYILDGMSGIGEDKTLRF